MKKFNQPSFEPIDSEEKELMKSIEQDEWQPVENLEQEKEKVSAMAGSYTTLEEKYPFIASWVVDGQIQIGQGDSSYSYEPMAAVIDAGGVVWETQNPFDSLDVLFEQMEKAIGRWCNDHGIELVDRQGNVIPWPED